MGAGDLNQVSESRDVQVHLHVYNCSCNEHYVTLLCCNCTYGAICVTQIRMKHKLHGLRVSTPPPRIQNSECAPAHFPFAPALAVHSLCTQQSRVLNDIKLYFVYSASIATLAGHIARRCAHARPGGGAV